MSAKDARGLYDLLERGGIKIWIDGGWAVDAVLCEQTRDHSDLDIALETRFLSRLREVMADRCFEQIPRDDTRPWNFVLGNGDGLEVDVHAFTFDENGNGVYGPPENGDYYWADALTGEGVIEGRPVRCISPEWLVRWHTGYELKETDFHDVRALCQRFGIELPDEYRLDGRTWLDHSSGTDRWTHGLEGVREEHATRDGHGEGA
jgi:lincosamide nucleotidyltransferase A/C/D/E